MRIDIESVQRSFEWHSSPVDWCEPNYAHFPWVVEFYNTFSNLIFFILPGILFFLYRDYAKRVNSLIQIVWLLFMIVGATSMYFHGTLTLMGQLMDEISIVWIAAYTIALLCPTIYMPRFAPNRTVFSILFFFLTIFVTIMSVWQPYINAFAQMFFIAIPTLSFLARELWLVRHVERKVFNLGMRSVVVMMIAIFIWFNDRIFCDFYKSHGITYLHAIWHLLSGIATSSTAVVSSYFYLRYDRPEIKFELTYWPLERMTVLGVPYVKILKLKNESEKMKKKV